MNSNDESGQMLLLTAVILAMGFIALASMGARIEQIPDEAELLQDEQFFSEINLMVEGIETTMNGLHDGNTVNLPAEYLSNLQGALAHMSAVEQARGFYMDAGTVSCTAVGGGVEVSVDVGLASVTKELFITVKQTIATTACA